MGHARVIYKIAQVPASIFGYSYVGVLIHVRNLHNWWLKSITYRQCSSPPCPDIVDFHSTHELCWKSMPDPFVLLLFMSLHVAQIVIVNISHRIAISMSTSFYAVEFSAGCHTNVNGIVYLLALPKSRNQLSDNFVRDPNGLRVHKYPNTRQFCNRRYIWRCRRLRRWEERRKRLSDLPWRIDWKLCSEWLEETLLAIFQQPPRKVIPTVSSVWGGTYPESCHQNSELICWGWKFVCVGTHGCWV